VVVGDHNVVAVVVVNDVVTLLISCQKMAYLVETSILGKKTKGTALHALPFVSVTLTLSFFVVSPSLFDFSL